MDPITERAIAQKARSQLGLITCDQLAGAGLSRRTRSRWVVDGRLVPTGARTFRLAGAPAGRRVDILAACLDLDAVASHATAGWLHGLRPLPSRIDVTVTNDRSRGRIPNGARVRAHASTNLPPDDVVLVGPIPTTSVARTLLGLAALPRAELDDESLTSTIEDAVRRHLASDRWLWWLLEERRCRGRNGVRRFASVLAGRAALGPTESWLERELLRLLGGAGLPVPVVQRVIRRRGAFVARVDFAYPDLGIVIEALGYASHSSRRAQSEDLARASRLGLMGFTVHQFTYDHIVRDPSWVVSVVTEALEQARCRAAS